MIESEWRLVLTPGMSIGLLRLLLQEFGHPEEVISAPFEKLEPFLGKTGTKHLKNDSQRYVKNIFNWAQREKVEILPFSSPSYPKALLSYEESPSVLFLKGQLDALKGFMIAIVGTRRASSYGLKEAHRFAKELSSNGIIIVSGGARGIDREAHLGALKATGKTIAVLGTGLDVIYPKEHRKLYDKIQEMGALVSEFPPNTPPYPGNFPKRNRIISGLSGAVLIIEAPIKSGAIITAKWALEQGKEIFALPGKATDETFRGNHFLIRSGARLVQTPGELMEDLGIELKVRHEVKTTGEDLDEKEKNILSFFGDEPIHLDQIIAKTSLDISVVMSSLVLLEMKGKIKSLPGGNYVKVT